MNDEVQAESASSVISVEVAYALPEKQKILALQVPEGSIAYDVALQSGITQEFPDLNLSDAKMGVFGKAIKPKTHVLQSGDRIEIYRPLLIDPKESRKERAAKAAKNKS